MQWAEMLRVTLALIFIIVMILGLTFALKRAGALKQSGTGVFQVLAAIGLDNKQRLYLIQVGNEQLVVGSSAAGLTHLHTLQEKVEISQLPAAAGAQRFADVLRMVGKGWTP